VRDRSWICTIWNNQTIFGEQKDACSKPTEALRAI
jgi:hypothetical protein